MRSIAHIINPVNAQPGSELTRVQPITFETMKRAKVYAEGKVQVELYTAQFEEDCAIIPEYFTTTPNLEQSVADVANVSKDRKLPMLKDLLDQLYQNSEAEYFVFTNSDIALMPQFYVAINSYIDQGIDAFIINRRRVSKSYDDVNKIEEMYSESGKLHNGYDCFVFKRDLYSSFTLGQVCIGIPHVGNTLMHNMVCHSTNFELFTDKHLTIHIGTDIIKAWGDKGYLKHNRKEFLGVLKTLKPHFDIAKFPGANEPFFNRHFKWLMNPTLHYPTMFRLDFKQLGKKRKPRKKNEARKTNGRFYEWLQKKIGFK